MSLFDDDGFAVKTLSEDMHDLWKQLGAIRERIPEVTLLDYFAGHALSILLAGHGGKTADTFREEASRAAGFAYALAEAMLAERERRMKEAAP